METWRLIPLMRTSGQVQMAIDSWLLEQHRLGKHPPTLRFYTWSPVTLSLGYHQRQYPAFWNNLWQDSGIALVRRPSGGRAVLHQGDLTYAIVTSGLSASRLQAYQTISEFLIRGWHTLGVDLHYGQAGRDYRRSPNCFGTATVADLVTSNGAKLIGSAQLRKESAILQHGSMRLEPDAQLFQQVFEEEIRMPLNLVELAITGDVLVSTVMDALIASAIAQFQINLVEQPLTPSEWNEIEESNFSWRNQAIFSNAN